MATRHPGKRITSEELEVREAVKWYEESRAPGTPAHEAADAEQCLREHLLMMGPSTRPGSEWIYMVRRNSSKIERRQRTHKPLSDYKVARHY